MIKRMTQKAIMAVVFSAILVLTGCSGDTLDKTGDITRIVLDNGMQVLLKENHASPMATCLIFVQAGSKYEDRYNNGVTHFLEHLLFDGTASQTQEQLDHGIDRLGGYINAFTRKEFTAFLVSMPRDYIEYGMATQADMLFNSIFPEDKFAKERKIVIEEIKKDDDAEGSPAEAFFTEKAMAGTAYAQPVIGYESIISNIPREAIIDYYKRFYAPNNMMILMIGDFDSEQMAVKVQSIFGDFPRVELPPTPKKEYTPLKGKTVEHTTADVKSTYVKYSIEAPHFEIKDYYAFTLLEDYLSDKENSPLIKALKADTSPLASTVSAWLDTKEEFSRLNIDIISDKKNSADKIIEITDSVIQSLSENLLSAELLDGYKISRRCDEIYLSEKLHYYGFMIAPLMAITGYDYFSQLRENIDSVTIADVGLACRNYLDNPAYVTTAVEPQTGNKKIYQPQAPTVDEVTGYYETREFVEQNLSRGENFKMPEITPIPADQAKKHSSYLREVFENGLTVVIKSNPDSRVFALNVIGQNRSATEPKGKEGITDFVNRMIEKGTTGRSAEQLSAELSSIGANTTLYDNPWIPYDDRYTTRRFSFMKFETIDQFSERGIELFFDMVANPLFDSVAIEKERSNIFGLLARNTGSTYKTARNKYYSTLFSGTPYAGTIEGSYRTIQSITSNDLREHHKKMYSPENMIITVGTNHEPERVMAILRESFGRLPATGFVPQEPAKPETKKGVQRAHAKMDKDQIYIYMGNLLTSAKSPDSPALKVAGAILSSRLRQELREKHGLAYSVGASVALDKNFGWLTCTIGTGKENYKQATEGIIEQIERMKTEPPSDDELEEAINSIWGSSLMSRLSRINQAYYMGVYEYLGLGYNYDEVYIDKIRAVTKEQVVEVSKKYFDTENYTIATAGNLDFE